MSRRVSAVFVNHRDTEDAELRLGGLRFSAFLLHPVAHRRYVTGARLSDHAS
jgi:hypothetical protein